MHSYTLSLLSTLSTGLLLASGTSSFQSLSTASPLGQQRHFALERPSISHRNDARATRRPRDSGSKQRHIFHSEQVRGGAGRLKAVAINDPSEYRGQLLPRLARDTSITNNPTIATATLPGQLHTKRRPSVMTWILRYATSCRQMLPELAAESLGTFLLLQLALGIVLTAKYIPGAIEGVFPVALLTGMAITAASTAVSSKCAAHFNPAITWAMCLYRNFGWSKFIPYVIAQLVGAAGAALVNFGLYAPQIAEFEASNGIVRSSLQGIQTAKTMACYSSAPALTTFLAEAFGTFTLSAVVFALTSNRNKQAQGLFIPPIIGSTVALIITVIGPLSGASLNPIRELGPRLVLKLFGWSSTVAFHQLGLYAVSAMLGATMGGFLVEKFLYADDDRDNLMP